MRGNPNLRSKSEEKRIKVQKEQAALEFAPELIAKAIVHVSYSMEQLNKTRLTRGAIVTLVHAKSGVAKRDIELVLNNLEQLEEIWLKKVKQ